MRNPLPKACLSVGVAKVVGSTQIAKWADVLDSMSGSDWSELKTLEPRREEVRVCPTNYTREGRKA